jgi:hypothetical protein
LIQFIYGSDWLSELQASDPSINAGSCDGCMVITADSKHHAFIHACIQQLANELGYEISVSYE